MELRFISDGLWVCGPCWITRREDAQLAVWFGGCVVGVVISIYQATQIAEEYSE